MTCPAPGCNLNAGHGVRHSLSAEAGSETWEDYRPTSGKGEVHLTLACDLDCSACNRGSFLKKPHTPAMTLDNLRDFFRQADALNFKPWLTLVGGEPTLHPQFNEFVRECVAWAGERRVQIWSNAYRTEARQLVKLGRKDGAGVCNETRKPDGAVRGAVDGSFWVRDTFVSPSDYGLARDPCWQHQSVLCGISIDAEGYAPCAMGGMMAALLGADCRTKTLADLFDKERVAEMTKAMCAHCGFQWADRPEFEHGIDVDALPKLFDTPMSSTWEQAFRGRR